MLTVIELFFGFLLTKTKFPKKTEKKKNADVTRKEIMTVLDKLDVDYSNIKHFELTKMIVLCIRAYKRACETRRACQEK